MSFSPIFVVAGVLSVEVATPLRFACATAACPIFGDSKVGSFKGMAMRAMRSLGEVGWDRFAAEQVRSCCNRFKVLGIHAVAHPAKVVELHSGRDRPDEMLIRDAVCGCDASSSPALADAPIATRSGTHEQPAAVGCYLDFFHQPVHDRPLRRPWHRQHFTTTVFALLGK
jgi:hypothetical protein